MIRRHPKLFDLAKRVSRIRGGDLVYRQLLKLSKTTPKLQFLQVGSNDGLSNDPLREFIVRNPQWSGTFVEPVPAMLKRLIKNYAYLKRDNFQYMPVAVSDTAGSIPFYSVSREITKANPQGLLDQVGSLDRNHVASHLPRHIDPSAIETIAVPTLTIAAIIAATAPPDLIHLDVEGHEAKALATLDLRNHRPKMIILESKHLCDDDRKALVERLTSAGYGIIDDTIDMIATQ